LKFYLFRRFALSKDRSFYCLFWHYKHKIQTLLSPCFGNLIEYVLEGASWGWTHDSHDHRWTWKAHIPAALAEDFGLALRDITSKCWLSNSAFDGQTL